MPCREQLLKTNVTQYLRTLIAHQGPECVESSLLDEGTWFEGRYHSEDYPTAKAWMHNAESKHFYANSQHYCIEDDHARYFEGYALLSPNLLPFEHAWIVMPDGGVLDFTLELMEVEAAKQGIPTDTSQTVYFGMEIPVDFFVVTMLKAGETQPTLELFLKQEE